MAVKFGLAVDAQVAHALGVRAQELLLSGSAQGLPDQPVRAAGGRQGPHGHRARRRHEEAHRHHARAPRRGRGQVAARRPAEAVRHRPQSRRHAAHRNRLRARHAFGERGRGLSQEGAHAGALPRDLRRQHAGRLVPLRRQRVGAQGRRREVRHARRDQEHQFVPLRREGHQLRSRAPDRRARRRRQGGAGNAAVRSRTRARRAACVRRKRRTTIATSRIRTCCPWRSTRRTSRA